MRLLQGKKHGTIAIQPSKSYLHRLIILSALSGGGKIENANNSKDILATAGAVEAMGLGRCVFKQNAVTIEKVGAFNNAVNCGESGSTLRFLSIIALLLNREITFTGSGRLLERPVSALEEFCKAYGFEYTKENNSLKVKGRLRPGEYTISASASSQFVSGLLMALATFKEKSIVQIQGQSVSNAYIDITVEAINAFGVKAERNGNTITLEGGLKKQESVICESDWSHAAVFACMGALGGEITMTGLNQGSMQGDKAILSYLKEIGANITVEKDFVSVSKNKLVAADFNIDETPDLAPVLCAVLGLCKGKSTLYGINRLRIKESDRAQAICNMLKALGAGVELTEDKIIIDGVESYKGGSVSTFNDHRIAMMAAVASCGCDDIIEIDEESCVNKSAPLFWSEFAALGGKTEE